MNLQDIRKKYPQYDDLADEELVSKLHSRYYSDIPQKEFYSKVGFKTSGYQFGKSELEAVKTIGQTATALGTGIGAAVAAPVAQAATQVATGDFSPYVKTGHPIIDAPQSLVKAWRTGDTEKAREVNKTVAGKIAYQPTTEHAKLFMEKVAPYLGIPSILGNILEEDEKKTLELGKSLPNKTDEKIVNAVATVIQKIGTPVRSAFDAMGITGTARDLAKVALEFTGYGLVPKIAKSGGGLGKLADVVSEKTKAKLSEKVVTEKPKELVKTDIISEEAPKAYKVTVKDDSGKVIVGKEGETHAQQIDRLIQEGEPVSWGNETGFIDEAGKYIKQEQSPKVAAVLEKGKPAGVAKSIEAKAIEQGLIKDGFDNLAEYDPTTIKIQSERAADLLTDVEKTRRIVRGEEPIPEGLRGAAVIKAVEEHIKKTKDADMAAELANSNLATEVSLAGQELSLIRGRELDTPTAKLQAVKKARQEQAKLAPEKEVKIKRQLKEETKKNNLTKEEATWNRFLREIVC